MGLAPKTVFTPRVRDTVVRIILVALGIMPLGGLRRGGRPRDERQNFHRTLRVHRPRFRHRKQSFRHPLPAVSPWARPRFRRLPDSLL